MTSLVLRVDGGLVIHVEAFDVRLTTAFAGSVPNAVPRRREAEVACLALVGSNRYARYCTA